MKKKLHTATVRLTIDVFILGKNVGKQSDADVIGLAWDLIGLDEEQVRDVKSVAQVTEKMVEREGAGL